MAEEFAHHLSMLNTISRPTQFFSWNNVRHKTASAAIIQRFNLQGDTDIIYRIFYAASRVELYPKGLQYYNNLINRHHLC